MNNGISALDLDLIIYKATGLTVVAMMRASREAF